MSSEPLILIVDDQPENLLILEDLLMTDYQVQVANRGQTALDYLESGGRADLILLDVLMPDMDGFETCRRLKENPVWRDIPVLFLTSLSDADDESHGLSLGAEDFIHKPISPPVVLARVRTQLKLAQARHLIRDRNAELEYLVAERTRELLSKSQELIHRKQEIIAAQAATITAFCSLAETRDNETGNHIRRTQNYVRELALELRHHPRFANRLNDDLIDLLYRSAPLHDVGKVGIPDAILHKPGKLTTEEWEVMKLHCKLGRDAIAMAEEALASHEDSFLRYAREIAYGHHERWDGSGYPEGLSGEAIPLSARLMAVADVYDALITKRVYKPAFSHEMAIEIMARERGKHFDPDIIDVVLTDPERFEDVARRFADSQIEPSNRAS